MKKIICLGLSLATSTVMACGIEGKVVFRDGSKANGTEVISTSWNGKKAYPKNGYYKLDLGNKVCGETISIYLNGNQEIKVKVKDWVRIDYVTK